MSKRNAKIIFSILGIATLGYILYQLFLLSYFIAAGPFSTHAYDVSRRLSSPDGTKTVLLVRDYAFDLNFKLFVVDNSYSAPPDSNSYLWLSPDYNPETNQNFHEDLEWSKDSSVIAVIIDGEYVFAHDFSLNENIEGEERIKQLLETRTNP